MILNRNLGLYEQIIKKFWNKKIEIQIKLEGEWGGKSYLGAWKWSKALGLKVQNFGGKSKNGGDCEGMFGN